MLELGCHHAHTMRQSVMWLLVYLLSFSIALAEVMVIDDSDQPVRLSQPAQRIVSLAPHLTEMLFAAGAGEKIVGAVSFSDYPPAAKQIPRVGGYKSLDLETIVALQPDLIVAWSSGNNQSQLQRLQQLGYPMFINEPRLLEDIPRSIERLSILTGSKVQGHNAALQFRQQLAQLKQRYASRRKIKLFYQVWDQPLMTLSGQHLISDVMKLCSAKNVFAELPMLAPTINEEAVLASGAEVIIAGGMAQVRQDWLQRWRKWTVLPAVQHRHLYFINPDLLHRHSPRILQGAEQLCQFVDKAR